MNNLLFNRVISRIFYRDILKVQFLKYVDTLHGLILRIFGHIELLPDNLTIDRCVQCATLVVQSHGIYCTSSQDCLDVKKKERHHVIPFKLPISIFGGQENNVC